MTSPQSATVEAAERLIERFIPQPDVVERHETLVHAPADLVFDAAEHLDLQSIPLVRAIFWLRGFGVGIVLIRWLHLPAIRRAAEQRYRRHERIGASAMTSKKLSAVRLNQCASLLRWF